MNIHLTLQADIPDDDEVIARVRENSDYFSVLYERYFQRVYGYCLKRTSNVQIAEDLCSDIFIKVIEQARYLHRWEFRGMVVPYRT